MPMLILDSSTYLPDLLFASASYNVSPNMTDHRLHRAGKILTNAWHAYREVTYDCDIGYMEWKNEKEVFVTARYAPEKRYRGGCTSFFSDEACEKPKDKLILLDFNASFMATHHMFDLVEWMLKGSNVCFLLKIQY